MTTDAATAETTKRASLWARAVGFFNRPRKPLDARDVAAWVVDQFTLQADRVLLWVPVAFGSGAAI